MDTTTYLIHIALIALVVKQLREHRLDLRSLVLPLVLVGFAAHHYLTDIPTGGNDIGFDIILAGVGVTLGAICGLSTHMRLDGEGSVLARAGLVAAGAWVIGLGTRLGIAIASGHGLGPSIAHFSAAHQITGESAWTTAFVLMALCQVAVRLAIIHVRRMQMQRVTASETTIAAA